MKGHNLKKVFILFGSTGDLGRSAVEYFMNKDFDYFYFISRKQFEVNFKNENYRLIIAGDLSIEENVKYVFSNISKESSASYFLFDTIGGFSGGKNIWETAFNDWSKMLNMNLTTSFLIGKHFAKFIQGTNGGSICYTSAASGFKNEKGKIAYGLSKNAVNYLVKSIAVEGKEIRLCANAVAPNIIDTPANREWVDDENRLVNTKTICDAVYNFFNGYPEASGEIIQLMH